MSDIKEFGRIVKKCQNMTDSMITDGSYDHNEYMRGMANGMKILMAVLTNKEPEFIEAPDNLIVKKVQKYF